MSLLCNMLSRFVIAFRPRSKCLLNFMAAVTVRSNFGAQENKICHCFYFSPSICHEVMGMDVMTLSFWVLSFKLTFSLSSFTFIKRLFYFLFAFCAYCVPGLCCALNLNSIFWRWYNTLSRKHHLHPEEETGSESWRNFPKLTQLVSGGVRIWFHLN